jgi:DNA-binding GntR family transcriptional regulator
MSTKAISSSQRAVEQLRKLIFRGELGAGSDHLESELAERLGMSRTPIREAVLILEAQGLVEMRPRKGIRVLGLSPDDMRDIYDVLTELESLAAENAARHGYSSSDLETLATTISNMDAALELEDRDAWAAADERFHTELVRLGNNKRIEAIVGMMVDQVRRAKAMTLYMRPIPLKSNEDHRAVLEAIRSRDPAKAKSLHYSHRKHAKEMLTQLLETNRFRYL